MGICVVIVEFVHICGEVLQMIQRTKSHVNKPPTLGGEPTSGYQCVQSDHGGLSMFTYNC